MAFLPLHIDMTGRLCLVVGGGQVASRKALSLLASGCRVTVIAPRVSPLITKEIAEGNILWYERVYRPGDVSCFFLVIAATNDREVNRKISEEARKKGSLVNIVDDQGLSDVYFPAILRRGNLLVGISTGGKSPFLAGYLRKWLEKLLPDNIEMALDALFKEKQHQEYQDLGRDEKIQRYRKILDTFHLE